MDGRLVVEKMKTRKDRYNYKLHPQGWPKKRGFSEKYGR